MVLHKSIGIEDQEPSLLCLNQLQANVITVKDVPKILPDGDVKKPHSIYIPEEYVTILLTVKGVISGFDTGIPTQYKLNTCAHAVLTNNSICDLRGSDIY